MNARLRLHRDPPVEKATTPRAGGTDSVSSWLDMLTRMLPARQGAEVREELESHVRERVRDLVLAGTEEAAATRTAIAELGDAAAVAQRFREAARTPFRRLAMNLAVLGVAGAALITSVVAVRGTGPGGAPAPSYQPGVVERVVNGAEPSVPRIDATTDSLDVVLDKIGQSIKAQTVVRWPALGEAGVSAQQSVTVHTGPGSLSGVFDALNAAISASPDQRPVDFRLNDGVLEVAPPAWFDRRETTLVRYDLSPIEEQGIATEEFIALVVQFVSPEDWKDNGGEMAECRVLGRYAFVKAPARIHAGVRWFLDQFNGRADAPEGERHGAAGEAAVRVFPVQHTDAGETLEALKKLQSIREIDFTPWTVDANTNSIIGQAPPYQHEWVARALRDLDTPEHGQEKQRSAADPLGWRLHLNPAVRADGQLRLEAELRRPAEIDPVNLDVPLLEFRRQEPPVTQALAHRWLGGVLEGGALQPTVRALLLTHAPAGSALGAVRALLRGVEGAQLEMYVDGNTLILKGPNEDQVLAAEQVVWKLEELARVIKGETPPAATGR